MTYAGPLVTVRMLETHRASLDGVNVVELEAEMQASLPEHLAASFVQRGWATYQLEPPALPAEPEPDAWKPEPEAEELAPAVRRGSGGRPRLRR